MTVRIPRDVSKKLDLLARNTKRTKFYLASEAIASYGERDAWQVARIKASLDDAKSGSPGVPHAEVKRWVKSLGTENELPRPRQCSPYSTVRRAVLNWGVMKPAAMTVGAALLTGITLGLDACSQTVWVKPGATAQDFNSDSYACERDARQSSYFGGGLIGASNMQSFEERCMVAHGWSKAAPPGAAAPAYVPESPAAPGSPAHQQAVIDCIGKAAGQPPDVYRNCIAAIPP